MDLTGIYRACHQKATEHKLFPSAIGNILQDRSHTEPQKTLEFQEIEIISSVFSNHNTMRLEIN